MASSPIRINEATIDELQTLHGIGPQRAASIASFRQKVGPIRTIVDLAAAAAINVRTANDIAAQIDWYPGTENNRRSFWPLAITTLASLWLLSLGYRQHLTATDSAMETFFSVAVCLILSGGLLSTLDIAVTSSKRRASETTRLFPFGVAFFISGLIMLSGLTIVALVSELPDELNQSLMICMRFIIMVISIIWMIYAPAIVLRLFVGRSPVLMHRGRSVYEWSHLPFACMAAAFLLVDQPHWLEEIFSIWATVILTMNGYDLLQGRSAFATALSSLDVDRYHFLLRHHLGGDSSPESQSLGRLCLATALALVVLLLLAVLKQL